jgi:Tol biopolymer transport system component
MDTDGSNVVKLTPDSMQAGNANWSPDGARITFVDNFCSCPLNSQVFVMSSDGTGITQLTTAANALEPGFSPDGTKITFSLFADFTFPPGDVYVMSSTDGSGLTNLTNSPGIDDEVPDWGKAK